MLDPFKFVLFHGGRMAYSGKDLGAECYCVREKFPRLGENVFDRLKHDLFGQYDQIV